MSIIGAPDPREVCPGRADWSAWTRGSLDPETIDRLGLHLETCAGCLAVVEDVAAVTERDRDPISVLIREAISGIDRDGPSELVLEPNWGDAPPPPSESTERVGKYVLLEQIGWGGFGVVHRAFDTDLRRIVALKLARPGALDGEEARRRLLAEARAAGLDHQGIVTTLDAGEVDGRAFIVSSFCAGGSLEAWLGEHGPAPIRLAAIVVLALAEAVEHAHTEGVLHLDVKAANVLIDPAGVGWAEAGLGGRPRLADFGLARQLEATVEATGAATSRGARDGGGTLTSMAPEQISGEKCTPSTDVYALGALLYRMIAGQHALKGANPAATVRMIVDDDPVPLRRLRPETPLDLEAVTMKCLAKAPGARYRTAKSLADDLGRFLDGRRVIARHPGPISLGWRWVRRHPTLAATTALASAAVLAIAIGLYLSNRRYAALNRVLVARHYASEVNRSYLAWKAGDATQARSILDALIPEGPGGEDPRGFEWRFLRRLVAPDVAERTIAAHAAAAVGVAFSPDDSRLISCGLDGLVKLWDASDGRLLATFAGHVGDVNNVVFLGGDGRRAVSVGDDGTARIWSLDRGDDGPTLEGGVGKLYHLAASADGRLVVSAGPRSGLVAWDTRTGRRVAHLGHGASIAGLAISPTGESILAAVSDNPPRVDLWAVPVGLDGPWAEAPARTIPSAHSYPILNAVGVSRDSTIATCGADRTVRTIRGLDGSADPPWTGFHDGVECLAFAVDGRALAVGTSEGEVHIRSRSLAEDGAPQGESGDLVLLGNRRVHRVTFSTDGRSLAVASADGAVRILDRPEMEARAVADPLAKAVESTPAVHKALAIRPDGTRLAITQRLSSYRELSIRPWREVAAAPPGESPPASCLAYSPDGRLLAAGGAGGEIRLWDGPREVKRWRAGGAACLALGFTPDGHTLITACGDGGLRRWSVPSGEPLERLTGVSDRTWIDLAIAPDGLSAAAVTGNGEVAVFDIASGKLRARFRGHSGGCGAVAFAPDGTTFATTGHDRSVVIRDPATALPIRVLIGHGDWTEAVAYSPDGRTLVSGDAKGTLLFWQVATGSLLARFEHRYLGGVQGVAFTPDGTTLITKALLPDSQGYAYAWDGRLLPD